MRVLVVDTYYPAFLREHYAARPLLAREPYERQLASLLERSFGTSDAYSRGFRAQGHEAREVIANWMPLQARWAAEHGVAPVRRHLERLGTGQLATRAQRTLLRRIVREQAAWMDADVVYVQDTGILGRGNLEALRSDGRLVVGQLSSPHPPLELLQGYDLIFSSFPHYVERFPRSGIQTDYLPLAFDTAVLDRLRATGVDPDPRAERPHAIAFVGGFNLRLHVRGTELVERACAEFDIDVYGYGAPDLPRDSPILRNHHGEAWGLDMYAALARSRIVLNRHGEVAEDFANNMRLFEATGVGALLLTDAKRNMDDFFVTGEEVLTYRDGDELLALLHELARDDERRVAIAAAGQARTLRDHTYEHRLAHISRRLEALVGATSMARR